MEGCCTLSTFLVITNTALYLQCNKSPLDHCREAILALSGPQQRVFQTTAIMEADKGDI